MGTPGAMPMPGTDTVLAGRYRLGALLGRGGMAEVYDGFDERLQRPVAVKVLTPETAGRPDLRRRFEAEARAAARLSHPNVVAVFDSGETDGVPFLVMERLPGETLADRLKDGPLDPGWVRRMAGDVLGALGAAHLAGIVHRDVKPGNILMAADGCAKVADFGIAKSVEVDTDMTTTNLLVGTPAYVAPERIEGLPATPASDLYSLGVVLYEALAGRKPFQGANAVAVAYAVRHESAQPLAEVRPGLPPDLVAVVERAMAKDPEARFASAADMQRALDGDETAVAVAAPGPAPVHDGTQVLPVVPAFPPRVESAVGASDPGPRPWWRPRPARFAALVAALVLGLVLLAALGSGTQDTGTSPTPTTSTTTTIAPTTTTAPAPVADDDDDDDDDEDRGRGKGGKKGRDD